MGQGDTPSLWFSYGTYSLVFLESISIFFTSHPDPFPAKALLKSVTVIPASCYPDEPRLPHIVVALKPAEKYADFSKRFVSALYQSLVSF